MSDSSDYEGDRGRSKRRQFFHNVKESIKDEMMHHRTYDKSPYLSEGLRPPVDYNMRPNDYNMRRRVYSASPHPMGPMSMIPSPQGVGGGYSSYSPYYYESWTEWIVSWLDCIFSRPPPPVDPYGYNRPYEGHNNYLRPRSHSHLGAHLRPEAEYYGMYARSPSRRRPLL
ncbi:hypothetical protein TRVA0_001S05050 [Trichomonascus vanleenenianus]|uniref:uncharacterized protein n=1 Tax=Trichomonascus vanleenenianus TaxID=2268995 RepID=UPI003ECAD539